MRVFENRVLRILRPKRDKVTGELRKLHYEELIRTPYPVLLGCPNLEK
jgi:hypothetical protein